MRRKLAAIMFVDIVSYSAMMQQDETLAFSQGKRFKSIAKNLTEQFNGKVWQYYGDGALCIFDSAVEATECAVSLQLDFKNNPLLPVRIGIHTGEVIMDHEDLYGDGINIAARIEPICVPGGIYISGKAYDEIKNHKWLRGHSLGYHTMKNINEDIEVYAINNQGIEIPREKFRSKKRRRKSLDANPNEATTYVPGYNKWVASILALFFGIFGVHRFYLGQWIKGIFYFLGFLITLAMAIEEGVPAPLFMGLIGFIDFLVLLTMPKAKFDLKYNKQVVQKAKPKKVAMPKKGFRSRRQEKREKRKALPENTYKKDGMELFNDFDLEEAAERFQKALEYNPNDPEIHFMLAKCYSLQERTHNSLNHLAEAIELGFKDFETINMDQSLAYLRVQEPYARFVQNNYKLLRGLPEPTDDLLSEDDILDLDTFKRKEKLKAQNEDEDFFV